ncbi:MAG TPA: serine/threonine-protein kinase [Terriglobales bacterium]|nr:serine/threonine-protein kinase [Terriglobales bacterium]
MSDETSKRIGDYEILTELGEGGMGRVYKVRNVISDRIEAMKILLPDLAGRQELAARFLREIKLLASLNHPNIAQLRTAFTHENQLVMIMEYVEGTSLATRLHAGPIAVSDTLNYIDQVLNALGYAHQQNIIHRDIKPGNMMLTPQGVVKVMDFGIARSDSDRTLTLAGTSLGTINYMSPEQVKGEPADARSDLYSVGICLYEMVTGKKPFEAGSDYSIMSAHVKETPRPPVELQPEIPAALNEIILVAIAKDPNQRFQTANAFRNALSNVRRASSADMATLAAASTPSTSAYTAPATSASQIASLAAAPPSAQVTPIPQAPMPAPVPAPMPPPSTHRGLYMTLGALLVLAGLVVAGVYLPKRGKAGERAQATPAPVQPQPAPVAETPAPEATPAPEPPVVMAKQSQKIKTHTDQEGAGTPGPDIHHLEDEIDQLTARAGAVNSSLDHLRQQQASAGYGLRGDISGRQELMKVNLSRAQEAAEKGDAIKAKKYVDKTQADLDVLEKFLGR